MYSTYWDYLMSGAGSPGPQTLGQLGVNNGLNAFAGFGNQLQGAMGGMFATNALNSQNVQNLRNAQAQTAQGYYNAAGNTNAAISNSNALIEQARQQAAAQQQQWQSQLQQAQLRADADKEIARMQAEAARASADAQRGTLLDLERLKQEGNVNRISGMMPLFQSVLGALGGGGAGGLGNVSTNYGAGVQFQPSTQPSNAQAYRPMQRPGQGGLLGFLNQYVPQRGAM